MPQMAPLNWIFMFLVFILLMMVVINKIYFLSEKIKISNLNNKTQSNFQCKWLW